MLVGAQGLVPRTVEAEAPHDGARQAVSRGTVEAGFMSGFWQGNNAFANAPSANRSALYQLPRLGLILTDEWKAGFLSGNLELLLEPQLAHYYRPFNASAFGGSLLVKYNFLSFGRWMPFWDVGAGMLWTDLAPRIPEQSTTFNFVLQVGPGLHYFLTTHTAVTLGVRFHHISNAGLGRRNVGLNATLGYLGASVFLPD